jgi:hypothetical protein
LTNWVNATTDATLTEYLCAAANTDDSIDGAARLTHMQTGKGVWQIDGGQGLEEDPDEYRVECSCGAEYWSWGKATRHVADQ